MSQKHRTHKRKSNPILRRAKSLEETSQSREKAKTTTGVILRFRLMVYKIAVFLLYLCHFKKPICQPIEIDTVPFESYNLETKKGIRESFQSKRECVNNFSEFLRKEFPDEWETLRIEGTSQEQGTEIKQQSQWKIPNASRIVLNA